MTRKYYLPKDIIKNHIDIINRKNFYDQAIDWDMNQYEEIWKLTERQDQDYTNGCFLDYE